MLWHSFFHSSHINKSVLNYDKKALHYTAYRPLTHSMCIHQMSALIQWDPQVNKFEQVSGLDH